jgi:chemotaxis response regulator CheB
MPTDAGVGFVIIHLAPSRHSHLADILDSVTSMPVTQIEDGEPVRPNHVHVIGPNTYLAIEQGRFRVSASVKRPTIPMPIDYFMNSLAEDQKERAISIILTGADGDGTLGSKEIKAAGGLIMVQTPETAQHPSMPLSVIATGLADLVLPIEEMPAALIVRPACPNGWLRAETDATDEGAESDSGLCEPALDQFFAVTRSHVDAPSTPSHGTAQLRIAVRLLQSVRRTVRITRPD